MVEASEQLLRAELKSREEMEYLLLALRDLAMNKKTFTIRGQSGADSIGKARIVHAEIGGRAGYETEEGAARYGAEKARGTSGSLAAELAELRTTMEFLPFGTQRSDVQTSRVRSEGNKESGEDTTHLMPSSPVSSLCHCATDNLAS